MENIFVTNEEREEKASAVLVSDIYIVKLESWNF